MMSTPQEPVGDFDAYWGSLTPQQTAGIRKTGHDQMVNDAVRMAKGVGYGFFTPIQNLARLGAESAASLGSTRAAQSAQHIRDTIARHDAMYRTDATDIGGMLSPVNIAIGLRAPALLAPTIAGLTAPAGSPTPVVPPGSAPTTPLTLPTEPTYWGDVGSNVLTANLGGGLMHALGAVIAPKVPQHVRDLQRKGVVVPVGQAVESRFSKNMVDSAEALRAIFSIGKSVDDAVVNQSMNRALANDILAPLGKTVTSKNTQGMVSEMAEHVSAYYDDAYKALGTALPSKQFFTDVQTIRANASSTLNKKTLDKFNEIVNDNLIGRFNIPTKGQGKAISGEHLKDMRKHFSELDKDLQKKAYDADFDVIKLREYVKQLKKAVNSYTDEIDPKGTIKLANQARADMDVYQRAAASSTTGEAFDTKALAAAVQSASDFRNVAAGTGKLQEKAVPYIKTLTGEDFSTYSAGRKAAMFSAAIGGGAYAWVTNPYAAVAVLTVAGFSPQIMQAAVGNPTKWKALIQAAIRKLGPTQASAIAAQSGASSRTSARQEIEQSLGYQTK